MRPPFEHQTIGVAAILAHPRFFLADSMRLGKTRQAIDAAQELWLRGAIDAALVIAPGEVARSVWASQETGQIAEYTHVPTKLTLIRSGKSQTWGYTPGWAGGCVDHDSCLQGPCRQQRRLDWTVTNYELMRRPERLKALLASVSPRTMLILDESSAVNSPSSAQTKACFAIAEKCERVLLLNGTPHGDNPGHLYAPFKILDPKIIGCNNWYQFQAKYAKMGGFRKLRNIKTETGWRKMMQPVQIVGWVNLEDLYDRTKPYVLRRTLDDVFDLPPALDPVTLEVPLSPATWAIYREMRDNAILRLESGEVVSAAQAGVLVMRVSQITSGFVGGVEGQEEPAAIGDEKLEAAVAWFVSRLEEDPKFRAILWCRFRFEAERLLAKLALRCTTKLLYGGQTAEERAAAIALLGPGCPDRPAALVGIAKTGGLGLDLSGASTTLYVSNEYSLMVRDQSAARVLGPNQKYPCSYYDLVAVGPAGQKTVDHAILKALKDKGNIASWGAERWASELRNEDL